ncbi:MAG: PaaI family thioesterase [Firmicutes bacterium]|jgi:uncharacterized protein (TIGR00369 family)|nr:PaaI family thioesterase [Bacillota bacterium]
MSGFLKVPLSPYLELIGVRVDHLKYPCAGLTLSWAENLVNPMGTLHGGIIATLIDAAPGCVLLNEEDITGIATVEIKVNYFKAITAGVITARGEILYRKSATAFGQTRIYQGKDLVAIGSVTYKLAGKHKISKKIKTVVIKN